MEPVDTGEASFWNDINRRIRDGKIIPIIGNSVRNDRIFSLDGDETVSGDNGIEEVPLTTDEQLAEVWADSIGFPLQDRYELARVAQFNRVKSDDTEQAKTKYLTFLKLALLNIAAIDDETAEITEELQSQITELGFSDIVNELDLPSFTSEDDDPLRVLARLPLPIYVTTSFYDFLERAIEAEGREPRCQICFWSGEPSNVLAEHRPDPAYIPSVQNPLVYHLHGMEGYPRSMVLSEDDYLDFLVAVAQDTDVRKPVIPLYLREALAESSLLLLGYRLWDWDFRVLFRGIINLQDSNLRMYGLVIQLDPEEQSGIVNGMEAKNYLREYFEPSKFKVEWGDSEEFISKLWQEWKKWRQGG
jgi:hypothetical protein